MSTYINVDGQNYNEKEPIKSVILTITDITPYVEKPTFTVQNLVGLDTTNNRHEVTLWGQKEIQFNVRGCKIRIESAVDKDGKLKGVLVERNKKSQKLVIGVHGKANITILERVMPESVITEANPSNVVQMKALNPAETMTTIRYRIEQNSRLFQMVWDKTMEFGEKYNLDSMVVYKIAWGWYSQLTREGLDLDFPLDEEPPSNEAKAA
jgi:hypothetical protein